MGGRNIMTGRWKDDNQDIGAASDCLAHCIRRITSSTIAGSIASTASPLPQGDTDNRMNNSNSSSNPTSPRATLKLRAGARKSPRESKTPPIPRAQNTSQLKPGARWSDEYKERMQRDMDALTR
jgi:hypothetical protein